MLLISQILNFVVLYRVKQNNTTEVTENTSMGESNTILSAYTKYRLLE